MDKPMYFNRRLTDELADKQDIDTLVEAYYSIKRLATDKENLLGKKMTDEEVFNEIRAKCNDAISYIKHAIFLNKQKTIGLNENKEDRNITS